MFEKYIEGILYDYRTNIGIEISESFLNCSYSSIEFEFTRSTGIRIGNRANIAFVYKENFFLESGSISRMPICLYLNHNWITVIICWQSVSGKIYKPEDDILDCNEVRFWFENLDVKLVHECMHPGGELPFKTDNLGYELEVQGLDMDMHIRLYFLPAKEMDGNDAILSIDNYIDTFNLKSEKKDRKDGVVHNWKRHMEEDSLVYELDLGSAGLKFFSGLLKHFAKLGLFERVVVGGD